MLFIYLCDIEVEHGCYFVMIFPGRFNQELINLFAKYYLTPYMYFNKLLIQDFKES